MAFTELISRGSTSGGHRLVAAAAVLNMLWQAAGAAAVEPPPNITVREERGVYSVAARFLVDQPPSVALTVLTDYEQIPRFMPEIRTSRVRERGRGRAVVEQEAAAHVMLFTKRVHLVLEIDEQPDALIFRDRCGLNFARYEGAWRFSQQNGRTTIAYELIAEPSFDVPGFMLKRLFRRDAGQMIEGLKREIAARAASPAGVTPQSLK